MCMQLPLAYPVRPWLVLLPAPLRARTHAHARAQDKVMRYEAVHPIGSWGELRQRLGPARRVYAFTHPSMPGEPLVVLHTALMQQVWGEARGGGVTHVPGGHCVEHRTPTQYAPR